MHNEVLALFLFRVFKCKCNVFVLINCISLVTAQFLMQPKNDRIQTLSMEEVDDQLKWSTQLSSAIRKVSRGIGMLKYSKRYLPKESLIMLYRSLVEPYVRYCCPVWGSCGASALDKLQKLQNRAARIVANSPCDASALPLMGSLRWLAIRELIDFETSKMVYKSQNALAPDYLRNIFQKVSEATNYQLRNSKTDLRLPLLRTSTGQKSFAYRGAKVWSDLDSVVKASLSFCSFCSLRTDFTYVAEE